MEPIDEYREKLGQEWHAVPIDDYGNPQAAGGLA
jgi:hypothetical protein